MKFIIIDELIPLEYTSIDIQKILGWNTLRVMREIEEIGTNKVEQEKHCIEPAYQMGKVISDRLPLLTAKLNGIVSDEDELTIVLNDTYYLAVYDEQTAMISLQVEKSLKEKFHVITFIFNDQRETRIFYIE